MEQPGRFVKCADTNTVGTIISRFCPKLEAFFIIRIPLQHTGVVRNIVAFPGHFAIRNGL
jgi:hypothetical protein